MENRGQADQGESHGKNYQTDAGRDFLKMLGSIHTKKLDDFLASDRPVHDRVTALPSTNDFRDTGFRGSASRERSANGKMDDPDWARVGARMTLAVEFTGDFPTDTDNRH
jgi:hypothetical protein